MSRRKFDEDYKSKAVRYRLNNSHKTLEEIAKDLGIWNSTLSTWLRLHYKSTMHVSQGLTPEQSELKRLKRENEELKELNEVLKKAHKYFVNQSL